MTENQSDVYQISLNHEQFLVEVTFLLGMLFMISTVPPFISFSISPSPFPCLVPRSLHFASVNRFWVTWCQAKKCPGLSSRKCHRNQLTVKAREKAEQELGN